MSDYDKPQMDGFKKPDAAPADPRLTARGREIDKQIRSIGAPAPGGLTGSTAPTMDK